ncbi:hypothetical protein MRX96_000137 [Rhipicephalus microplus]
MANPRMPCMRQNIDVNAMVAPGPPCPRGSKACGDPFIAMSSDEVALRCAPVATHRRPPVLGAEYSGDHVFQDVIAAIAVCCTAIASESSACETSAHSAIECVKDNESSSPDVDVLRANITDERHACSWVEDYGLKTNTSWVVDFVKPTAKCERMVFHKVWRCKETKREKSCGEAAAHCPAKIDLKIKKVNRNTKRNDAFLRGEKPLPAVIKLFHHKNHSHSTAATDALSRLTPTMQTRETFLAYFDSGMSPAEATRLHESKLLVQEDGYALVANSAVNPVPPAIYYWHRLCREKNFGKDVDPPLKDS